MHGLNTLETRTGQQQWDGRPWLGQGLLWSSRHCKVWGNQPVRMSSLSWSWQGRSCECHSHACLMGTHTVKILVPQRSRKKKNSTNPENMVRKFLSKLMQAYLRSYEHIFYCFQCMHPGLHSCTVNCQIDKSVLEIIRTICVLKFSIFIECYIKLGWQMH